MAAPAACDNAGLVSLHRLPSPARCLHCHPATPSALPLQLRVSLGAAGSEAGPGLLMHYELQGDVTRLRLPEPAPPGPADGLWQHTCFEAFVGLADEPAYREFNFSPSGQWAAYRFRDQRQRDPAAETAVQPDIEPHITDRTLSMRVWLPLHALPAPRAGQVWQVGLSAVIETADGPLSYWALQHPGPRPDFHHRGGWQTLPELPAMLLPTARP